MCLSGSETCSTAPRPSSLPSSTSFHLPPPPMTLWPASVGDTAHSLQLLSVCRSVWLLVRLPTSPLHAHIFTHAQVTTTSPLTFLSVIYFPSQPPSLPLPHPTFSFIHRPLTWNKRHWRCLSSCFIYFVIVVCLWLNDDNLS